MAFGVKTNEREGVRAQARYLRVSAYKARAVLDLIRGLGHGASRQAISSPARRGTSSSMP